MNTYCVYIMSNKSQTLYTGVTNNLRRRVIEHGQGRQNTFTGKYNCTWLVFYEAFANVNDAIAAEKKIKGWVRAKKLKLILAGNPLFRDLSADWIDSEEPDSSVAVAPSE